VHRIEVSEDKSNRWKVAGMEELGISRDDHTGKWLTGMKKVAREAYYQGGNS